VGLSDCIILSWCSRCFGAAAFMVAKDTEDVGG
jgi:hypothetical protein